MRSVVDELVSEFLDLRSVISSVAPVNAALSAHQSPVIGQYLTLRRRFDYSALIVAIYASYEKFAEGLVVSYARLVARRSVYSSLPPELISKHMKRSAEMLVRGNVGRGRYVGITELEVVKNLCDCLSGATPYMLNEVAIAHHDLNLRYDELSGLFSPVGITCDKLRMADPMLAWFCDVNDLPHPPDGGVPHTTVQQRLDELVERRNEVAHRGGNPDDLLGVDQLEDLVNFMEALARSVFSVVVAEYLKNHHVESGTTHRLELREGPFQKGLVIVVARPGCKLRKWQPIFVLLGNGMARWGRIQELRIDGLVYDEVHDAISGETIGIMLDFKCPRAASIFVLEEEDDLVWHPADPHTFSAERNSL